MGKTNLLTMHVLFWAAWILTTLGINLIVSRPTAFFVTLPNYFISIVLFYAVYSFVYKPFLKKNRKVIFALPVFCLLFIFFHFIRVFTVQAIVSLEVSKPGSKLGYLNKDLIANSLSYFLQYSIFSFGYWVGMSTFQRQKRITELELDNHSLEKKQLLTELNFLKAQINPHFLYNTLNTLYAQAQPHSEQLADNIMKLSEIMRYSLESVDNEKGTVQLRKELEHLQNLIDIHQLRFSDTLKIIFTIEGNADNHQVPPLSFITAVENAFKHGDLKNADHPLRISVNIEKKYIYFHCSNKKKKGSVERSHGIGIDNMKKRLNIAFQNKYEMLTKNGPESYTFELILNT